MSHKEYTQFENNKKIKFYFLNKDVFDHKQVIVEGIRKDHSKYKIICDDGIKDLISYLNNNNFRTLWSCEGDNKCTAYVSVSRHNLSENKINQLNKIIVNYWKDSFRIVKFQEENRIVFYSFTKVRWERKVEHCKKMELKTGVHFYFGDILK